VLKDNKPLPADKPTTNGRPSSTVAPKKADKSTKKTNKAYEKENCKEKTCCGSEKGDRYSISSRLIEC